MRDIRLALLAVSIVSLMSAPASAGFKEFFNKINPAAAKYETFKGKYIDNVTTQIITSSEEAPSTVDDINKTLEEAPPAAGTPSITGADLARFHSDSLLGNKKINAYMQGIIKRLLAGTQWEKLAWRVDIALNHAHTALTYPDGMVIISLRQLLDVASEDELAMLLAHETSHVLLNHFESDWFVHSQKKLVAAGGVSLGMIEEIAQKIPESSANTKSVKKKLRMLVRLKEISTDLLYPAWQRTQEEEADLLGMDLMIRAGYNPDDVFEIYLKNKQAEDDQKAGEEQQVRYQEILNEQVKQAMLSAGTMEGFFDKFGDVLLGALDGIRNKFKRTHPEYEKRLGFLADYRGREYAELESPESQSANWMRLRNHPSLDGLLDENLKATKAVKFVDTGDVAAAASIVYKLQKSKYRYEPYIQLVSAQVRHKQDNLREARGYLEHAIKDDRAGFTAHRELADLLGQAGYPQEAALVLRDASNKFLDLPNLRINLIFWTNQAGDRAEAERLALDCRLTYPDYESDCMEKLKVPVVQRLAEDLGSFKSVKKLARSEVQKLQAILIQLGYPVGVADGLPGNKTKQAVNRFQRDSKLPMTGRLDQTTVAKLYKLNPGI